MNQINVLQMRILMSFLSREEKSHKVTAIARKLGESVKQVSRAVIALEKEGLVDRSDIYRPRLTEQGQIRAEDYEERVRLLQHHFLYEGADAATAEYEAYHCALIHKASTMENIRRADSLYFVKNAMRENAHFDGKQLCRKMADGVYSFPFVIYRSQAQMGQLISHGDKGFEHPCELIVKNGSGRFLFRIRQISRSLTYDGEERQGTVISMQYLYLGQYQEAEVNGTLISVPAEVVSFVNIGADSTQVMHGTLPIRLKVSVGEQYMPQSEAVAVIWI